jgi:L-malate glycosyltransferase
MENNPTSPRLTRMNRFITNKQPSRARMRKDTAMPEGPVQGTDPNGARTRENLPAPTGILKILQCSNLGGMEQVAYSLLRDLSREGAFRFRVVTPRPFGDGESILREIDPACQSFEYKGKFGWRSLPVFRRHIRSLAAQSKYVWLTGTCACSLAAIRGLPQQKVLGHHFHHFGGRGAYLRWFGFYHGLCRQLDAITYPTDFTRNEALRIAPWLRARAHVVPYGYPVNYQDEATRLSEQAAARRSLDLPTEAFIVGNAGWLIPRKRFDVFLQTARRIKERFSRAFFVICGGGPLDKELRELARKLGLADCVRFTGWVRDPACYYRAWDACLFNSDFDALGRTPMEAASHGCLVAASVRHGGLSEYLVHGENGILLSTHDTDVLAREVVNLARNRAQAAAFRQAGAEKLRTDYSVEKSLEFYQSLFA